MYRSCIHICSGTKSACWFPNLLPRSGFLDYVGVFCLL
jgi:hypothetical protein